MIKAINEIKESIKLIDVVVEILDARLPLSSRNKKIIELAQDKKKIVVLNKIDLADDKMTNKFKSYFESLGITVICMNANNKNDIANLLKTITKVSESLNKYKNKSIEIKPIYRILIAGIPNVGKSTIINKLSNKNSLNVSNRPGVTVKKQWIKISGNIELLDTPGILWPDLNEGAAGLKLALTGNIKQDILDSETLAFEGLKLLISKNKYNNILKEKYKISNINAEIEDIVSEIGKKTGCLVKGGEIDVEKASNIFLNDLRSGKIAKITLDDID